MPRLSPSMIEAEFDNGYWYATEIKEFAKSLGLTQANRLRKDELEKAIKAFLRTGHAQMPTKRSLQRTGVKDVESGLRLDLRIVNYTSNKATKDFIVREAQKMAPGLRRKSGARYRLNRWREEQLTQGRKITYRDLVRQYVKLNQFTGRFERVAVGRYINFLSDFMRLEKKPTRAAALRAWKKLKKLERPKNYSSWVTYASNLSKEPVQP